MIHSKILVRQEQYKPKPSTKKEIIKIREEMNETETKRMHRIDESKNKFFE